MISEMNENWGWGVRGFLYEDTLKIKLTFGNVNFRNFPSATYPPFSVSTSEKELLLSFMSILNIFVPYSG